MKNRINYILVTGVFISVLAFFQTANASELHPVFEKRNVFSSLKKYLSPRDTIVGDTGKLKFPFKDYNNNPNIRKLYSPLFLKTPSNINSGVEYDSKNREFIFYDRIGNLNYRDPFVMPYDEFRKYDVKSSTRNYWRERSSTDGSKSGAAGANLLNKYLSPNISIPIAGLDRIFGTNAISIKPQGSAELIFGININKTENPLLPLNLQRSINFDFDEKIQMGVTGKIGDKMKLGINYNTEATFDFENQTTIGYTGHEDEIIQTIEAGNVTLPLAGSLITGSHSLFGIKTALKFGKLMITSVASQQKSTSSKIEVQGGAQTSKYKFSASEYEANRHFFLSQYFRDNYETALQNLPVIASGVNITKIEVWVTNRSGNFENSRNVVAFMDLAESTKNIYNQSLFYKNPVAVEYPSNELNNLYEMMTKTYSVIRDINQVTKTLQQLTPQNFVSSQDYEKVENARKLGATEFTLNPKLGIISLNTALNADEVLAVAYEYTVNGVVYQVGEFSNGGVNSPQALVMKMLKATVTNPRLPRWKLMMKNVYSIGAYQINADKFTMNILYQNDKTGASVNYLPEGRIKNKILLQVMNLDRLNTQLDPQPDGVFDFIDKVTINASNGRIFFPVLEPFGNFLKNQIADSVIAQRFIFRELYDSTQSQAQQIAEKNKYLIEGTYSSAGGSEINLNAMNIPQGSVKVSAGGMNLTEGSDYTVDYTLGRVSILNHGLLESGTPIQISLENNSMFNVGTKNLFGSHLNYQFSDKFNIGGTILHLTEKPLTNKVNIGDEPISNTIWGLDGNYSTEAPFLTKWVDKIPFIDTKEMSTISFSGEFAKLVPGHSSAIDKSGTSYIDDFEGSRTPIDLKAPTNWYLASTPQGQPSLFKEGDLMNNMSYGYNRAKLAWYSITPDLLRNTSIVPSYITKDDQSNHYVREVYETEIFPNKQPESGIPQVLSVLNLAYYPSEKGPYNYDVKGLTGISAGIDENGLLKNPASRWGGIMKKIVTNDFETANIEILEFWMMDPFIYDSINHSGDLYFNLGNISEDVLRDGRKSFENGLASTVDTTVWGRVPVKQSIVNAFDNNQARELQDIGMDGLNDADEKKFFSRYLDSVATLYGAGSKAYKIASDDPSSDDYHFFRGGDYDEQKLSIIDRYKKFNGLEGNSPIASAESFPASSLPDVEDINQDQTLSESESYFQYRIHLSPEEMRIGKNYITNIMVANPTLKNGNDARVKWYQFKVPIHEPDSRVGAIQDFKSIRFIRMFMKNWNKNVVLRFAKMDLVKGEWRKYTFDLSEATEAVSTPQLNDGNLDVSVVNIEENGTKTPVNYVLPPGIDRVIDPTNPQMRQLNEQALVLKAKGLEDGDARATYRNVDLDVRQYKRLKMYAHAEAVDGYSLEDGELTVFIRIGSDYKQNYYEYEIPLKITARGTYLDNDEGREKVWAPENNFDIDFELFQRVKQNRNNELRRFGTTLNITTPFSILEGQNKITVCGNPNLSNIKTIMIGVRNPNRKNTNRRDDGLPKTGEIWVNEFRLTDFNETGGWAANARIAAKLADFANVTVSGNTSTHGFGSIEKKVNERQKEDIYQYDLSSNVELGKFFPQKAGVRIPMFVGYSESFSNPQYNPLDPDIPLSATLSNPELTKADKDSIKHVSQDYTRRKSINFTNVQIKGKQAQGGGSAKFYSISNFTTSYVYKEVFIRNINTEYNLLKNYIGSLNYTFTNTPKNIQPFSRIKFLSKPALSLIKDFNFYYAPAMVAFRTEMNRNYNEIQLRNISSPGLVIPATFKKDFNWVRTFDLRYNLSKNIKVDFSSNTQARIDEPQGRINKNDDDYEQKRDSILHNIYNLGRTTQYHHTLDVNWNVPINKLPGFDWTTLTARYQAAYDWNTGPILADTSKFRPGNTIKNSANAQLNANFSFDRLYSRVPYFKAVNDRFTKAGRQASKKEYKTITYTKDKTKLTANEPRTITHGLGSEEVTVKVTDAKGVEVKVETQVVSVNKLKITSKTDVKGATVIVSAKKEKMENIFVILSDYTIKALTGIKNLSVSYTRTDGTVLPGYTPSARVLGTSPVNNEYAPGLGFIFGAQKRSFVEHAAQSGWLTTDTMLNAAFAMAHTETWNFRSTVEPINNVKIELSATRTFTRNGNFYWNVQNNAYNQKSQVFTGSFRMSYNIIFTAFKKVGTDEFYTSEAYTNFINNRETVAWRLASDRKSGSRNRNYDPNAGNLNTKTNVIDYTYPTGYSALSQEVLIPSLLAAYSDKSADKIGLNMFPMIPLPNWRLTYDGLSNISFLKPIFRTVTLNHAYTSNYSVGSFATNPNFDFNGQFSDGFSYVRDKVNAMYIPEQEVASMVVDEQFAPLVGIDIAWVGNLSTKLEYKRNRSYTLNFSNTQLIETYDKEFVVGASYKFAQLPIIIKAGGKQNKFKSDLNLRADLSIRDQMTIYRKVEENVTQLQAGQRNVSIKASADYVLSERFNLKVFYDQTINAPKMSTSFRTSNAKFGISIRFTLIP